MEEITFDKEARDKLISGINKLAKAVGGTMGPKGCTVIIPDSNEYGKYKITKDGVSVANSIYFKDPIENIGAQMIKEVAELTVKLAGDGTTTATVLAAALINNLKDFNTVDINKALDEIIPKVIEQLKANSRTLEHSDIKHVATISANNDVAIGELIQEAYNFSPITKVEKSSNTEDKLELIDGMSLHTTYLSKHFITDVKKGICELNEPEVLVIDGKIDSLTPFTSLLNRIAKEEKSLLIITEHVHENALRLLESNVLSGSLKLCVMKSPGFSTHRKNLLSDIAAFTGTEVIRDFTKPFTTGKLKSCKLTSNNSILLKDNSIDINDLIENLTSFSKVDELEDYDKELLEQRISNLTAKVSVIKVGGKSELEVSERYDRYDDAIRAVACALEEGIVEGGGEALYRISLNKTLDPIELLIYDSIKEPVRKINSLIDARNISMFDLNIIDPLKVTRCALENAVSVAKTILSTNAVVLNNTEWKI